MSVATGQSGVGSEVGLGRARALLAASTLDDAALRRWLHGLAGVDEAA